MSGTPWSGRVIEPDDKELFKEWPEDSAARFDTPEDYAKALDRASET